MQNRMKMVFAKVYLTLTEKINSFFSTTLTEKEARRGFPEDRFYYAKELSNKGDDHSLIDAYVWLSLMDNYPDYKQEILRLVHQVSFELKRRMLFDQATVKEKQYRLLYSYEVLRQQINQSKNPVDLLIRLIEKIALPFEASIYWIDEKILQGKITSSQCTWIGMMLSISAFILLFTCKGDFWSSLLLGLNVISIMIICAIDEKRAAEEQQKEN